MSDESLMLQSFRLTADDIANAEIDQLLTLSVGVGWPHRREDWELLRRVGQGIIARDEVGRVLGSAMWFSYNPEFATVGMVITTPRLQTYGAGRWLMMQLMERCGRPHIGLNATSEAYRLYLGLDFTPECTLYQRQGLITAAPTMTMRETDQLRWATLADLPHIAALDAKAFKSDRRMLLATLFELSKGVVLVRQDRIEAFALSRRFGRGQVIGPIVACNDDDACAVSEPLIAEQIGGFVRIDTREEHGAFVNFLERCGLKMFDTLTTMSLGGRWMSKMHGRSTLPIAFGLAGHSLS